MNDGEKELKLETKQLRAVELFRKGATEHYDEAVSHATSAGGLFRDEVAISAAKAEYEISMRRADLRSMEYKQTEVVMDMVILAATNAAEAKHQSRFIAQKMNRIEFMVFIGFAILLGGYFTG